MPQSNDIAIPENYVRLEGSERHPSPSARLLGPADPNEHFDVTIVLRRRLDGETVPDFVYFKTPPSTRPRLSEEEFARKYGASDDDIREVTEFVYRNGLIVEETHAARRTLVVSGTAEQMSQAFGVKLGQYEHKVARRRWQDPVTETYRGRDGFIYVPHDLEGIIVGVFGLDNRRITKRNSGDPSNTTTITVPQITKLYQFPTNSGAGQTIAILSEAGYQTADIKKYFSDLGMAVPAITDITVDASNDGTGDPETTQDVCIAGSAAPGAAIVVYFTTFDQKGWVDLISRVAHPKAGDPVCSVLSSSFYVSNGDDAVTLNSEGVSTSWLNAVTAGFQDAAIRASRFASRPAIPALIPRWAMEKRTSSIPPAIRGYSRWAAPRLATSAGLRLMSTSGTTRTRSRGLILRAQLAAASATSLLSPPTRAGPEFLLRSTIITSAVAFRT
jgi:kumamolisin